MNIWSSAPAESPTMPKRNSAAPSATPIPNGVIGNDVNTSRIGANIKTANMGLSYPRTVSPKYQAKQARQCARTEIKSEITSVPT